MKDPTRTATHRTVIINGCPIYTRYWTSTWFNREKKHHDPFNPKFWKARVDALNDQGIEVELQRIRDIEATKAEHIERKNSERTISI